MTTARTFLPCAGSFHSQVSPTCGLSAGIRILSYTVVYLSIMKVLVCGPRIWVEQQPILDVLRLLPQDTLVVHGGARGVDNIAGFVAKNLLGLQVRSYPVDHSLDGAWPAAGVRRNLRMLASENPHESDGTLVDLALVFTLTEEFSKGTGHMAKTLALGEVPFLKVFYRKSGWANTLESLKKQVETFLQSVAF